ncbi:TIGR03752 family integrating conjugative element protein [Ectothiorhodospira haloalkaliphila]|nr:TIGR03752 family integrating conjugative element protein [Ectothiorhodospira haloalkaliphila]
MAQGNRLLPIIGVVVALMAVFVLLRACGDAPDEAVQLREVPQAPSPDADSPAETLATVTAQMEAMTEESERLRQQNEALMRELERRDRHLDREVSQRVARELEQRDPAQARGLERIMERIDQIAGRVDEIDRPSADDWDIPVGLGLEADRPQRMPERETAPPPERTRWVDPLGWDEDSETPPPRRRMLEESTTEPSARQTSRTQAGDAVARATQTVSRLLPGVEQGEEGRRAVYTVPRNSTLMNSTAMTALIGRIPRGGTVDDPVPFKIIQGRDNLAANGHHIPGIEAMVWSGTAFGDWNLSCVRGTLDSVTFIFDDGTIRTLPDANPAVGPGEPRDGTGDTEPLGWISDERGYPCVTGERVTNAPQYLASRAGLAGLAAAGEAIAAGETTTTITAEGTRIGTITGDQGRYVGGQMVSTGADEIVRWLIERQEQSFDAIVTPPGENVTLHVERELRIDYVPEPRGRKLNHEARQHRTLRLD